MWLVLHSVSHIGLRQKISVNVTAKFEIEKTNRNNSQRAHLHLVVDATRLPCVPRGGLEKKKIHKFLGKCFFVKSPTPVHVTSYLGEFFACTSFLSDGISLKLRGRA